jgi:hypothetical protein
MTLDPKVRALLDLTADAPTIGSVPAQVMREDTPSHMAELMGLLGYRLPRPYPHERRSGAKDMRVEVGM